jgi:hypothetical protein
LINGFAKYFIDAINEKHLPGYNNAMNKMDIVLKGLWGFAVKPILDCWISGTIRRRVTPWT